MPLKSKISTFVLVLSQFCFVVQSFVSVKSIDCKINDIKTSNDIVDFSTTRCSNKMKLRMLSPSFLGTVGSAASVAAVVAFHEAGHFFAAKWQNISVESFNIGYGPKIFSFNDSTNTEFAFRALPLGGYVAFPVNVETDEEGEIIRELDDPNLIQNRPPLQRAIVISAGVIANLLLTLALASGTSLTTGLSKPTFAPGILVTGMPDKNSPAVLAGIKENDIITKLNGDVIAGSFTTVEEFISKVRNNPNIPLKLEILRGQEVITTEVTPALASTGKGTIGIGITSKILSVETIIAKNPIEAVQRGAEETKQLISATWTSFSRTVQTGFTGDEVGGPLAVVKTGAQMAAYNPTALIGFAATLSVNLAVMNALPFPALDGGQLVFVIVEALVGKPLPRQLKETITVLAFFLLLGLGTYTLVGDISKFSQPVLGAPISTMMNPKPN